MTEDYFVSVIIPNYNYAHFVGDAIESVIAQTYNNFELIVIDNGSTDSSRKVLEEYEKEYSPKLRVIFQENRGQAGSRNRGVEESKGDLIAFLDADDVWLTNKLKEQTKLFNNNDIGLVYSNYYVVDEHLSILKEKKAKYRGDVLHVFATAGSLAVVDGGESNAVIRKECFEKVGIFNYDLEESTGWDLYRRVASCYKIDYVDSPLMMYRLHGNNLHKRNRKMYMQWEKHVKKMFEDPQSKQIWHLKKQGYSQMHYGIASSHLTSKNILNMVFHLIIALILYPPIICKMLRELKKKV